MEADINFVVDASSSVGTANWELVKAFMNNIVDKFVIGDDNVSPSFFPCFSPTAPVDDNLSPSYFP